MDFTELGLSEKTIKAIKEAGIITPTTVQADVIPSILAGKDVFTIAPAVCGKTCSYVFPLIDIISRHEAQNILIITANSKQSVNVSDRFAVFNKYHEITESTVTENEEDINNEANVIIASPNLLIDLLKEEKIDLSQTDILVVDDINLIKKLHQLENLEKILEVLPADKQNIIYTNRRSKETQSILDKILKTPEEFKIDKAKEQEAVQEETIPSKDMPVATEKTPVAENSKPDAVKKTDKKAKSVKKENEQDSEALHLAKKYHTFGRNTPAFLLGKAELAEDNQ
ncbi:MAG: DEAD/DEAH box helicase [Alphaproteobacteria bacterium]|nr:DEAD/DEAH box helicase [Alphaproteobacteria bacterium]